MIPIRDPEYLRLDVSYHVRDTVLSLEDLMHVMHREHEMDSLNVFDIQMRQARTKLLPPPARKPVMFRVLNVGMVPEKMHSLLHR
jgi:DNA-binding response OmpR family regulator